MMRQRLSPRLEISSASNRLASRLKEISTEDREVRKGSKRGRETNMRHS
jgi:hypothetical protein